MQIQGQTMKKRKTKAAFAEEHELFLVLHSEGKTILEIMEDLGLSKVQFNKHLLTALTSGEITEFAPTYKTIQLRALPQDCRELLDGDGEALVKIEKQGDCVLLSVIGSQQI